jgi:hypothetical protein
MKTSFSTEELNEIALILRLGLARSWHQNYVGLESNIKLKFLSFKTGTILLLHVLKTECNGKAHLCLSSKTSF